MLWDVREDPLGEKSSSKSFREFRGRCASTCPTGASGAWALWLGGTSY